MKGRYKRHFTSHYLMLIRKKNRANKYDFLCELCEQEYHISFVRFFFLINIYKDL